MEFNCISYVPSNNPTTVEHETVSFDSKKINNISKAQAATIVEQITPAVVEEAKKEWIESAQNSDQYLECGADTAYCNTGGNSQLHLLLVSSKTVTRWFNFMYLRDFKKVKKV